MNLATYAGAFCCFESNNSAFLPLPYNSRMYTAILTVSSVVFNHFYIEVYVLKAET